ncbi:hypothetical protein [Patulibacter sp. SYSU D01012]|uniref:DUF445 domain-containing protein n=1 Tax=Patulibacter sp. SYSU D01012 TaxID=2817381 RepID=UPI001FED7BF6|nr:hypothetical protein [Patulibacter sp. SYSU D01012]
MIAALLPLATTFHVLGLEIGLQELITVPLFMGAIGWITNWTAVWMLFNPLEFKGVKVPGLWILVRLLPRKVQEIPGVMHGGVGWQGIIPSRAAKMGSIAVDKGISKLGSAADFYRQLEPDKIAEHMVASVGPELRPLVERIMEREHPRLWHDLPPQVRETVHARVRAQLPDIIREITDEIGEHIDQLLDVKLMVIRHLERRPELSNRIFQEVGRKELRFMVNFGFVFAFLLGFPVVVLTELVHFWLVLPVLGTFVGWATNLVGIWMIFEPARPRRILGIRLQGLFLRRQREAADVYAGVISEEVLTLAAIGDELLHGPRSDRTRLMLETALRPAVDRAIGPARTAVRLVMGGRSYDAVRDSVAVEAVQYTMTPLLDPEFNRVQGERIRTLIRDRLRAMPPEDFVEMLRTAMKEDEWLLFLHGAVLGFGAGLLHLAIFG